MKFLGDEECNNSNRIVVRYLEHRFWKIRNTKTNIPEGYEVVYDANNKPYFVKAQTTLEKVVKHDKPEDNSLTKVILQSLNTTPQKCYVWDTKEVGYEYGKSILNNNNALNKVWRKKTVGYEYGNYIGWNVFTLLNNIIIGAFNFLVLLLCIFLGETPTGEAIEILGTFFIAVVFIFMFILTLL